MFRTHLEDKGRNISTSSKVFPSSTLEILIFYSFKNQQTLVFMGESGPIWANQNKQEKVKPIILFDHYILLFLFCRLLFVICHMSFVICHLSSVGAKVSQFWQCLKKLSSGQVLPSLAKFSQM